MKTILQKLVLPCEAELMWTEQSKSETVEWSDNAQATIIEKYDVADELRRSLLPQDNAVDAAVVRW